MNKNNKQEDCDFLWLNHTEKGKTMRFYKNGKLMDEEIASALRQAVNEFENGELIEVRDLLQDIVDAIDEFESDAEW